MHSCQDVEEKLSSFTDLQLNGEEMLQTVDHILECTHCRHFYQQARLLDKRLGEVRADHVESPMSPKLWRQIRRAAGLPTPRFSFASPRFLWGSVLAAAVLVASIGLWTLKAIDRAVMELPGTVDVVLESQPDKMNDARFVMLTKEILESDRKYRNKMLEIMQEFAAPRGEIRMQEKARTPEGMSPENGELRASEPTEMT